MDTGDFKAEEDLALVMGGHGPCTFLLLSLVSLVLLWGTTHRLAAPHRRERPPAPTPPTIPPAYR